MNNYIGMLSKDLRRLWKDLEFTQKIAIVALVIIATIAISYFVAKSTEPSWGVLYSDLSEPDAVAVIENLKKAGYPYKLSDDKKTILVPVDMKEDLRVMIAENDVIHDSNPGFELLDKIQLGATDFQNKLTRQRIFQGELTRTIERIKGVKKARVQIADPERSVFSDHDEAPSASVMLILDPGTKLKSDQVKAIKNLVAYGIPRLTPERVFISDQYGDPLSDDINRGSSDLNEYRANFESETAKKVTQVIEKLVGPENVSVQVSAVMNFDSARSTIERYFPANDSGTSQQGAPTRATTATAPEGIIQSAQSESEVYGNGATPPGGTVTGTAPGKNYEKTKVLKNYNVSKEVKQVIYAPGSVQRMTIAVALNKILTTEEKEEIKNLIISASGADPARGDIITITGMQFASEEGASVTSKMISEIDKASKVEFWVRYVAPLVVVLILGLSALFILSSLIKKPLSGEEIYDSEGYYESEDDDTELLEAASIPMIEAKLEPELERMKTELNNIIMSDPNESARLLQSYIKE